MIRRLLFALAALALPVAIAIPASASSRWAEAHASHHFRVGTNHLLVGWRLRESRTGRYVNVKDQGRTWCEPDSGLCYPVVKIRYAADSSICWAGDSAFDAINNLCTASYTLWAYAVSNDGTTIRFDNIRLSGEAGRTIALSGHNRVGSPLELRGSGLGFYQAFKRAS